MSLLAELKRRNVIRAGLLYIGAVWALVQGVAQLSPAVGLPDMAARWFLIAACIGFPFWLAFAWFYEWTPQGLRRESEIAADASITRSTGRKMDRAIIAVLTVAVVLLLTDRFVLRKGDAAAVTPAKSIAVLPLLNESADPQQEYFSDGLSEELISALGQVRDLKVIGRNSSFRFRGKDQDDTAGIGVKLGVATLLQGTVRKQGDEVRIVASLIKAADGSQLWSQSYKRQLQDVFAVQSDIATNVANALKASVFGGAIQNTDKPPSGNLDAYDAMLQGRFYAERRNRADYLKAVDYYQQAIKLDSDYAMAYARLAIAQQWFNNWAANADERRTTSPLARANATKAVDLAPQSAVALGALGINQAWSDVDYRAAEATLKKAVALDPANAETLYQLADVTGCLGRLDEAIAMMRRVLTMEPLNASFHFYTGQFLLAIGRLDEAEAELRRAIDLQPTAEAFRAYLAMAYIKQGKLDQALLAAKSEPAPAQQRAALAMVHFAQGDKARGEAQLTEIIRLDADYSQILIADIYALRGDADQVFAWLDRGLAKGDPGMTAVYEDPFLVPVLREDPRLTAALRQLGLPSPAELDARGVSTAK
ncbi:tetratricopeptide repeat protein [Rudaea sp.]|uniref:tetratricopeptide repeat protein n=1 Tax=Rudaea sp. TaxID=2136325 RepID=UPI00322084FB